MSESRPVRACSAAGGAGSPHDVHRPSTIAQRLCKAKSDVGLSGGTALAPGSDMTLERYLRRDLVLLPSTASVQAGARALEKSGVGSLLVCDDGKLVGIVTARDIAVSVVARGLDPARTRLFDVMSREVATLPAGASSGEAGRLMLERCVRRIPLTDGSMPVGIVTLDDLMLEQELSGSMIAAIIRSQQSGAAEPRFSSGLWTVPAAAESAVA